MNTAARPAPAPAAGEAATAAGATFAVARERALEELTAAVGQVKASAALGVSQATYCRHQRRSPPPPRPPRRGRRAHPRALGTAERDQVVAVLHSEECADMAPEAVRARLLDGGVYPCSSAWRFRRWRR